MRLPSHIRAVYFDAVGTIIHTAEPVHEKYAAIASQYGQVFDPTEIRERLSLAFRDEERIDCTTGWVTSENREEQRWRTIVSRSLPNLADLEGCFWTLFDSYGRAEAWCVDPALEQLIPELQSRHRIVGVASNLDRRLRTVMNSHPVLGRLASNLTVSSEVGWRKPSEEFFRHILQRHPELAAQEIAYVGDDIENDYHGASRVGMCAILLDPTGRHPEIAGTIRSLAELSSV